VQRARRVAIANSAVTRTNLGSLPGTIAVAIDATEFNRGEPLLYEFAVKGRGGISLVTAKITGNILDLARYASKISRKISHLTIQFPDIQNRENNRRNREPSFTEQGNIWGIEMVSLWQPPRRTQYSNYYCEKQASFSIWHIRSPGRRCLASDRQQDSGRRRRWARSISAAKCSSIAPAVASACTTTPTSILRSCAASVKFADPR
jgi:hypothetical protein